MAISTSIALSKLHWATEAKALAVSTLITSAVVWIPLGLILLGRLLYRRWHEWSWRTRALVLLLVAVTLKSPARYWRGLRQMKFWDAVVAYFDPQIWSNGTLPAQPLLFCFVPHGIFPIGQAVGLVSWLDKAFRSMRPAVADSMIRAPLFGPFLTMLGCVPASAEGIKAAVSAGDSVCLIPGGIQEMLETSPGVQSLCLVGRKGFIKLALSQGIPLVPVYVFGNTDTFSLDSVAQSSLLKRLSRKLGVALLWFWGRWNLPVPFRAPLRYALGEAILVPHTAHPSAQEIDHWHGVFVTAVKALYDNHKVSYYGSAAPALKII